MGRISRTLLALLLASLLAADGCGKSDQSTQKRYTVTQWGFSIVPPEGWLPAQDAPQEQIVFAGPDGGRITIQRVFKSFKSFDDMADYANQKLAADKEHFSVVSKGKISIARSATACSTEFGFVASKKGWQGIMFAIPENTSRIFIIVYDCDGEAFDKHKNDFINSAMTAELK